MNNNCNIADKRPKRRKDKNNPYTIYSVGIETDHPRYFVEFDDSEGTHQCIEIDEKNFKLFDQFELEDLSYLNEINRHYGELDNKELSTEDDTTWQIVLSRLDHERLHSFIDQLPEIQKRRLLLYYFENYTYQQIGDMEGCEYQTIQDSIRTAKKFLKKLLKSDL